MARDEEDAAVADSFRWPDEDEADPRPIVAQLIEECEDFADLQKGRAKILTVFRCFYKEKGGRHILGTMGLPRFGGAMNDFAMWLLALANADEIPDFILTIDALWWAAASPFEREALVHHELCHCEHATDKDGELKFTDEGLPVWTIRAHDLEEFNATVRRYGAWKGDITAFSQSLDSHQPRRGR